MNKNSIIDYCSCILFKLFGPIIRSLPLGFSLFLGRRLGDLFYYFDIRHKAIAYANIKTALGAKLSPLETSRLTRKSYRAFGQNLVEMLLIPKVNKEYINKYINIEGLDYVREGLKKGKGVILLAVHEGSWELSNIIAANLGLPFILFVREQRYPRLDKLLNSYRSLKACKIIQRENGIRQLIEALESNQAIGMTLDQGGRSGTLVKFFAKDASMSTGAIKIALKYGATIIPVFYARLNGPYIKVIIEPPLEIKTTGDFKKDTLENLQRAVNIFEKYILKYPQEYLWTYKIWKYAREKNILILSDGKTGHLRQSQAVAKIITGYLGEKGINTQVNCIEIAFKSRPSGGALTLSSALAGKFYCQGCLFCLKTFLRKDVYLSLIGFVPDMVISCGSGVAPVNYILSRESASKSIVIMRPSILSTRRFDLVIMPKHDNPAKRKNVVVTEGALNLIDEEYLREQSLKLSQGSGLKVQGFGIGLLIGGETKSFHLEKEAMLQVARQIKSASEKLNTDILVTTSRRTSKEIENLLKEEFKGYPRCKLLIIANEKNIPEAVGGILGLSQIIITSPESVSLISEAVSSKKYVLVFKSRGVSKKHQRFLGHFAKNKYIYLTETQKLNKAIEDIWMNKPPIHSPRDNSLVGEAIERIL